MSISGLRDDLQERLAGFLWIQWGQMGVPASIRGSDNRAADPEASLLLTFEVGREEPRLFEEVLGWLIVNERLVSVQRLRNLATDDGDRALVEAVVGWLGQSRRRPRLGAKSSGSPGERDPRPFFRNLALPVTDPDPAFLAHGFLKAATERSGKSRSPNLRLPINLAFSLRLLLGVSVRSEVIRVLLTTDTPWMNANTLAASTAYSKRNVQEALTSLAADDFVTSWVVGNENRYEIPSDRWTNFLRTDRVPASIEWPQVSRSFRRILRWLDATADEELSDYMFSSRARTLMEEVAPDLTFAGVPVNPVDSSRDLASFEYFVLDLARNFLSVDL